MSAAPLTLRFTEWRCGHHGQRPNDIPVHSVEQAQLILQAIANAISQPGHARAALFDDTKGTSVYLTDDYTDTIRQGWPSRTVVYHGSQAEIDEMQTLGAAFDYAYGGTLTRWDGRTYLDDLEVITSLSVAEIETLIAPLDWTEEGQRSAVCEVPPVLKPAAELLAELREAAEELAAEESQETGSAS
jgi:hypothetical protein